MGATHISGESRRVEEKALRDPRQAVYSGVGLALNGFQVRGLETISASRCNGRCLDSSLKRLRTSCVLIVATWKVTRSLRAADGIAKSIDRDQLDLPVCHREKVQLLG